MERGSQDSQPLTTRGSDRGEERGLGSREKGVGVGVGVAVGSQTLGREKCSCTFSLSDPW